MRLERSAAQGRTVARLGASESGFVLLVSRGAPGEEVEVEIERVEARHALARVVAVERAAPERIVAPCVHYAKCGGCDLQHLAYTAQLEAKRFAFLDQLQRIGGLASPPSFEITPAPEPFRYRDRLDYMLAVGGPKNRLVPVFHAAHGDALVPISDCLLAPAELSRLAHDVVAALTAGNARPALARLRVQQVLAEGGLGGAFAVTLIAPTAAAARKVARARERWLPGLIAQQPGLVHVGIVTNSKPGEDEDGVGDPEIVHGEPFPAKAVDASSYGTWRYRISPDAFFQVHPVQAGQLIAHVIDALRQHLPPVPGTPPALLDLYCGVGLFSLPLGAAGYRVHGIELSETAVRSARLATREAHERGAFAGGRRPEFNVRNLDDKDALEEICRTFGRPDEILMDPPRRGLSARLVKSLLNVKPSVLAYVSCDGGSFARDAARLSERYDLHQIRGFDLFPQTHHLETVAVFLLRSG